MKPLMGHEWIEEEYYRATLRFEKDLRLHTFTRSKQQCYNITAFMKQFDKWLATRGDEYEVLKIERIKKVRQTSVYYDIKWEA